MGLRSLRAAIGVLAISGAYSTIALLPVGSASPDAGLTFVSAGALALSVVVVAMRMTASRSRQLGVWFTLLFANLASVAVEGTLFAPAAAPPSSLGANLVRLFVASGVVAGLAAALFGRAGGTRVAAPSPRSVTQWWWRLLAAAAIYTVAYLVIGGVNYTLVTHPYYEAHVSGLTLPAAQTVVFYEPARGLLIALSVLPLTLALRLPIRSVAVVAGAMLFVVGGLVPLLPQTSLPLGLRLASLGEIFGQNFLTGLACAYLFIGGRQAAHSKPTVRRGGRSAA